MLGRVMYKFVMFDCSASENVVSLPTCCTEMARFHPCLTLYLSRPCQTFFVELVFSSSCHKSSWQIHLVSRPHRLYAVMAPHHFQVETTMQSAADKTVPVHSNIGTSEWLFWKLSFVALATNEGCATLAGCDRILRSLPQEWKHSILTPKFKKGNPSDPSNYRPIALTCTCC